MPNKFAIYDINAKPIPACARIPLSEHYYLSISTLFNWPAMRVFKFSAKDGKEVDVTDHFFLAGDVDVYPNGEAIAHAFASVSSVAAKLKDL